MALTMLAQYFQGICNDSLAVFVRVSCEICGKVHNNLYVNTRISTRILQTTISDSVAINAYDTGDAADLLDLRRPFRYYICQLCLGGKMGPAPFYLSLGARASAAS